MQIIQKFSRFSCALSALGYSHHSNTEVYPLNRLLHFVILCQFMAVFFTLGCVVPDKEFGDHDRKLIKPLDVTKDDKKYTKCVSRAILF